MQRVIWQSPAVFFSILPAVRRAWNYLFGLERFGLQNVPLPWRILIYVWIYFWAISVPTVTVLVFLDLIFRWGWFGDSGGHCNPITGDCLDPP